MIRRVSGLEFDGSCINITIGLTQIPFIGFTYGDNVKPEWVRELGSQVPTADTPGVYETTEGKLKMRSSVARALLFPFLPQFGAANAFTQMVVNYLHPDIGFDSDQLVDARILGAAASLEASAKAAEIELPARYRLVKWTSKRVCFGSEFGGFALGTMLL